MLKFMKLTVWLVVFAGSVGVHALHAEWLEDGIPIGTAGGTQDSPAITSDSTGGAVIVWRDSRVPANNDIYAQGVEADGTIRWLLSGVAVCTAANSQSDPLIITDGFDGTIIAWHDERTGGSVDIYVQRLSSIGTIQWPSDGVAICAGQTGLILGGMVSDGAGGAIITWHDRRNSFGDIFAQRIDADGAVMWTANGVPVCSAGNHQQYPVLAPDGTGGAIIVWEDRRSGTYDIYAQRLDAGGTPQWTIDGVVICDYDQIQLSPQIVEDDSGGAIIAWSDRRNSLGFDIYAQRIDSNGDLQWGLDTAVSALANDQSECRLIHIGSGETIVTWLDERSGTSTDIFAQKLSAAGTVQWAGNGVATCTVSGDQDNVRITGNGSGGAFISWDDERAGTSDINIFAQNIGPDGSAAWTANGEEICGFSGNQREGVISADGSNGLFAAWSDGRGGIDKVYSQRVDAAGSIPTATLLYHYSFETSGTDITIDWTLSELDEGVEFRIFRADGPVKEFKEIQAVDLIEDDLSFSFVDRNCKPGITYYYQVYFSDGTESTILFESGPVTTPAMALVLHQNMPNPFNPNTVIGYYVPEHCRVRLEVYDVKGRVVKVLVDESQPEGSYSIDWNGRYTNGAETASGIYFYRLTAGKAALSRKMILLR